LKLILLIKSRIIQMNNTDLLLMRGK